MSKKFTTSQRIALGVVFAALIAVVAYVFFSQSKNPNSASSNHWITEASNDTERFERIEKYLRGFDQPMWEVGERYQHMYQALKDKNYDLALYHWEKIKITIENGAMKRPAREENAKAIFLDDLWQSVYDEIASRDHNRAWEGFDMARDSCMSCHTAEKVEFVNNQPLFRNTEPPKLR
jgi:hypothetical protein